jgi:hypothetical protein
MKLKSRKLNRYGKIILLLVAIIWGITEISDNLGVSSYLSDKITQEQQTETKSTEEDKCCKICKKGKACGDSCISKDKTCHKQPGCACDG